MNVNIKIFIIRLLVKLLKYFSDGRVGVIYHSKSHVTKKEKDDELFYIVSETLRKYYNVGYGELVNKSRRRPISEKRQLLHFLAYKYTGLSTTEIGKRTNRDHATVLYSKKVVSNLLETDKQILSQYIDLCGEIEKNLIK
jgi:chromosomal replication initiation ATPase DnaA